MKKFFAPLISTLLLSGCQSTGQWVAFNTSNNNPTKDFNECKYSATKDGYVKMDAFTGPIEAGMQTSWQQNELFSNCMQARGYRFVDNAELKLYKTRYNTFQQAYSEAIREEEYQQALTLSQAFSNQYPDLDWPKIFVAQLQHKLGDYDAALSQLNQHFTDEDSLIRAATVKASSYLFKGDLDLAEMVINDETISDLEKIQGYYSVESYIYIKKGRFNDAFNAANKGLLLSSSDISLQKNKGLALIGLGQHQKGLIMVKEAIQSHEDDAYIATAMGDAYQILGEREKAFKAYTTSCQLGRKLICDILESDYGDYRSAAPSFSSK